MSHKRLLSSLIEIPSLSNQEAVIQEFIINWFLDRRIETQVIGDNLVAHIPGHDSTRAFILNSHMDTVSPGQIDQMHQVDEYALSEQLPQSVSLYRGIKDGWSAT